MMKVSLPSAIFCGLVLVAVAGLYSSLSLLVDCEPGKGLGPATVLERSLQSLPINHGDSSLRATAFGRLEDQSEDRDRALTAAPPLSAQKWVPQRELSSSSSSSPSPGKPKYPFKLEIIFPKIARDDDLVGKSCRFTVEHHEWDCRDCGLASKFSNWEDCPVLKRNHMCGDSTNNFDWDRPLPRSYTFLDPLELETQHVLTHYHEADKQYAQIPCEPMEKCWDMTKCSSEGPLTVYVHHSSDKIDKKYNRFADLAAERYPAAIEVVQDPSEACLLVVSCEAFDTLQELQESPLWNEGRNHFIWESNRCFDTHADRPFERPVHYARAALGTSSLVDANIRKHYDMPLARTSQFTISEQNYTRVLDSMGQDRRWLVAFKGNVYNDWPHIWFTHRWMAAEYWDKSDEQVAFDVTCDIKKNYTNEYDYLSLLMDSTFAFCPGGGATQSFRFTEALGLGAIPVVTPDVLPPFAYDLDWSGCMVRVSAARIVDLPRILRSISKEEIQQRQHRCQELFEKTVGWMEVGNDKWKIDTRRTMFMASLKTWAWRIRQYLATKQAREELEESLFVVSKDGAALQAS